MLGGFADFVIEHQRLGISTVATAWAAMPSRRPVKPSLSVVVAFTLTRSAIDAGDARDAGHHGVAMRADARRLADQGEVEMHDAAAARRQQLDGVAQEAVGRDAAPLRIGRREVLADVAGADRAQHGVGQRMQRHVGVGMAGEGVRVRDGDAAQHHGVARAEAVHVEAEGGAGFHRDAAEDPRPW